MLLHRTSRGLNAGLSLWLPLEDLGAGAVNTTPASSAGSATATFTRATTATTILSTGLIGSVASGTARSCYSPAGVYLGYLAEEARTNLCLQSADLSNASWTKANTTIGGSVTLPDGTTGTVNKIQETAVTNTFTTFQAFTKAASALTYTFSIFFKQAERGWAQIMLWDGATNGNRYWFNLATGAIGSTQVIGTGFTATSYSTVAMANGWYRCIVTATSTTATTLAAYIRTATADTIDSYAGTLGSGIYAWGAQLEQAAFATSYIPTTTVAVARNADVLTYPASGNIVDAAGTAYCEAQLGQAPVAGIDNALLGFSNVATPPMYMYSPGGATAIRSFDGTTGFDKTGLASRVGSVGKQAVSWSGAARSMTGDGQTPATSTYDGAWVGAALGIGTYNGSNFLNGTIKNVRIWTRAFADSQLVSLTS